jgi:RNA polymerase sigma-70 factor (ECF subfamily)
MLPAMASDHEQVPGPASDFAGLIAAVARDRDRTAFAGLFRHFAPRVKTLMLRLGASAEQADELAQEALLTVWHKAHLFDPQGASASGWIFRIARNLRIDAVRRARRLDAIGSDPTNDPADVAQPDGIVAASQLQAHVRSAIGKLSPEQLHVITLSFLESRPHAEIAERLQLPLGTVKSRLRLAMKRLRELLEEVA